MVYVCLSVCLFVCVCVLVEIIISSQNSVEWQHWSYMQSIKFWCVCLQERWHETLTQEKFAYHLVEVYVLNVIHMLIWNWSREIGEFVRHECECRFESLMKWKSASSDSKNEHRDKPFSIYFICLHVQTVETIKEFFWLNVFGEDIPSDVRKTGIKQPPDAKELWA